MNRMTSLLLSANHVPPWQLSVSWFAQIHYDARAMESIDIMRSWERGFDAGRARIFVHVEVSCDNQVNVRKSPQGQSFSPEPDGPNLAIRF